MSSIPSSEMADRLQRIIDRDAIHDVLARYVRGIDRNDAAMLRGVYWEDATDDHGFFKGTGLEFIAMSMEMAKDFAMIHVLGSTFIDLQGDLAYCDTPFIAFHSPHRNQSGHAYVLGGRYVDRLEKRGGSEWRIAERVVTHELSFVPSSVEEYPSFNLFVQSEKFPIDIGYKHSIRSGVA